mgnify:CR=1 FL=1|tara:strand:+ start:2706 stop:3473 length:768 start_codon:yes stop_codon:yes gene_type:complete
MVTINFEIEGFDLADIIKSVAGQSGVNINIYTLQEVSDSIPDGMVNREVIENDFSIEEEIELIDDSLTFDEKNEFALKLREQGLSWSKVGRALGITAKSASRRLKLHLQKRANAKAKAERKQKQHDAEAMKPVFAGISDEDLIQGIHATISIAVSESKGNRGVYLSSDYATVMKDVHGKKNYRQTPELREFKRTIDKRCEELFRKVGMCLGAGVAISGNTFDENDNPTVQILVVRPNKIPTYEKLVETMKKNNLI